MTDKRTEPTLRGLTATFIDQFHLLERSIFSREEALESGVVQITSSHSGEGVTSITLGLASVLTGQFDPDEILVVEANLREPSFQDIMDIRTRGSLRGVLAGTEPIDAAIEKVEDLGFSVMPAGAGDWGGEPATGESMILHLSALLAELRKKYRYVLLDTPPVIPFVDAAIVCGMADGVVLVVESNLTRSEVVDSAIEKIRSGGGVILGVVLNKREFHIPKWVYRYL